MLNKQLQNPTADRGLHPTLIRWNTKTTIFGFGITMLCFLLSKSLTLYILRHCHTWVLSNSIIHKSGKKAHDETTLTRGEESVKWLVTPTMICTNICTTFSLLWGFEGFMSKINYLNFSYLTRRWSWDCVPICTMTPVRLAQIANNGPLPTIFFITFFSLQNIGSCQPLLLWRRKQDLPACNNPFKCHLIVFHRVTTNQPTWHHKFVILAYLRLNRLPGVDTAVTLHMPIDTKCINIKTTCYLHSWTNPRLRLVWISWVELIKVHLNPE